MNFKQATDALLESVTLDDLATSMKISVQSLRQARSTEGAAGYRNPPEGWEAAAAKLASARARELDKLAARLQKDR